MKFSFEMYKKRFSTTLLLIIPALLHVGGQNDRPELSFAFLDLLINSLMVTIILNIVMYYYLFL